MRATTLKRTDPEAPAKHVSPRALIRLAMSLACFSFLSMPVTAQETQTDTGSPPPVSDANERDDSVEADDFDLDAELEALIAELDPPPLEEILSWFEPFPTTESLLARAVTDARRTDDSTAHNAAIARMQQLVAEGKGLRRTGRFAEAIPLVEETLRLKERYKGKDHPETVEMTQVLSILRTLIELPHEDQAALARAYELEARLEEIDAGGRYADAVPLLLESWRIREPYTHLGWPENIDTLSALSWYVERAGFPALAATLKRAALARYVTTVGKQSLKVADCLNDLGTLAIEAAEFGTAEQLLVKALEIRLQRMGYADTDALQYLNNLSAVYWHVDDHSTAEMILRTLIERGRASEGRLSKPIATWLHNLGTLVRRRGALAAAEPLLWEALTIDQELWGDAHPYVAASLDQLGILYRAAGNYSGAEACFRRALRIRRQAFGVTHPRVARDLLQLGRLQRAEGNGEAAIELFREALSMYRDRLGATHPSTLQAQKALAAALTASGRHDEGFTLLGKCLKAARELYGEKAPQLADFLSAYGTFLATRGPRDRLDEAERMLVEALEIRRQYPDANLYIALTEYARFLQRFRGRPKAALALYRDAIDQLETLRTMSLGDELDRARHWSHLDRWDVFSGIVRAQLAVGATDTNRSSSGRVSAARDAFAYLERGRGRALAELIGRSGRGLPESIRLVASRTGDEPLRLRLDELLHRERNARHARVSSSKKRASLLRGPSRADSATKTEDLTRVVDSARTEERQIARQLFMLARRTLGSGSLEPMSAERTSTQMQANDLLLAYDVGRTDVILLTVQPSGDVRAKTLKRPDTSDMTPEEFEAICARIFGDAAGEGAGIGRGSAGTAQRANESLGTLVPAEWREDISRAARVFIVPDGPLHQMPFEALIWSEDTGELWIDEGPPIVYGPSATVIMTKRKWAQERRDANKGEYAAALVAVGDPVFKRQEAGETVTPGTPVPDHGVLLTKVMADSNAALGGLRDGDVLLAYDGAKLGGPQDLGAAIQQAEARRHKATEAQRESGETAKDSTRGAEPPTSQPVPDRVPVTVWRSGKTLELTLAPGRMGVQPSQCSMPTALHDWRELQLSEDERFVKYASAATRDGFGELRPLPGTRVEVEAIGRLMRKAGAKADAIKVLAGEDATLTKLFAAAEKPRFLHLATHGLAESGRKVYESSLALTLPEDPTPDDFGFLRLQDLLYKWGGKLEGTELVVLSGCRTATGRLEAADGFVGLTWGFLFAGADSVIASLWKVDDAATALLMTRLYENLLGTYDEPRWRYSAGTAMPKAEALHEAKRWLRHCTPEQNRKNLEQLGFDAADLEKRSRATTGRLPTEDPQTLPDPFDYSHPRYWAAFILIGDPG